MLRSKGIHLYLVLILLAVYLVNGIIAIPQNSVTYDEMDHWSYGKRILKLQPEKIYAYDDASAMPVSGLNAIPRAVEQIVNPGLRKTDAGFSDIMNGRYVTLVICLLTGMFIYKWSKYLFGKKAGLFSLFLFVFCPNLNAHATLLTTDAYAALFTVSTFYLFWRFVKKSGWKNFLLFSISIGLSQLVKPSLLHLFIILFFVSLILLVKRKTLFSGWKRNLLRALVMAGIVVLIINTGFFFKGIGTPLSFFDLKSETFVSLQSSFVKNIPLPFPAPYIEGLDMTMYMNRLGAGHIHVSGKNYLLGELKTGKGFWNYYFVVAFFKTPFSVLIALLAVPVLLILRRSKVRHSGAMMFLGFTVLYFLTFFGLFNNSQVGLRHVLMIYPLVYVALGSVMTTQIPDMYRYLSIPFFAILTGYAIFTYYRFYPNLISYHNELVRSKNVYRIMADSNVDYGQSVFRYERFRKLHPELKVPGSTPEAGRFILSIDVYVGVNDKYDTGWLNKNFKPSAHFDHCYLIFDISENELRQKGLKQ